MNLEDFESNKQIKHIILDIDNCCLDSREWLKYIPKEDTREGWNIYHSHHHLVKINDNMIDFVEDLIIFYGLESIDFITAREDIGNMRDITKKQLKSAFEDCFLFNNLNIRLYMRNTCDYSPSSIVKQNILYTHILPYKQIDLAIDDDIENIKMFEKNGIETLHYDKFCKSVDK